MASELSKLFNSLYLAILEHKIINVGVSQELEIWNNLVGKNNDTVNNFFSEFIFSYGIFHDLLEKSDAIGDNHDLKLSLIDGNILIEGESTSQKIINEKNPVEYEEVIFKWVFDKNGNLLLAE